MAKCKMQIINDETGEIICEEVIFEQSGTKIKKLIVDKMLSDAKSLEDINTDMLYAWCRITRELNDRGQVKIMGDHMELLKDSKLMEDITIAGYTIRVINKAHPFSGMLQKNRQTFITSWTELYEEIRCKDRKTQSKIKRFLTDNNIIREFNTGKGRRFVLNPFLARGASYSSQIAISLFEDFIKEGINMNSYPIRLLQAWGIIS